MYICIYVYFILWAFAFVRVFVFLFCTRMFVLVFALVCEGFPLQSNRNLADGSEVGEWGEEGTRGHTLGRRGSKGRNWRHYQQAHQYKPYMRSEIINQNKERKKKKNINRNTLHNTTRQGSGHGKPCKTQPVTHTCANTSVTTIKNLFESEAQFFK